MNRLSTTIYGIITGSLSAYYSCATSVRGIVIVAKIFITHKRFLEDLYIAKRVSQYDYNLIMFSSNGDGTIIKTVSVRFDLNRFSYIDSENFMKKLKMQKLLHTQIVERADAKSRTEIWPIFRGFLALDETI